MYQSLNTIPLVDRSFGVFLRGRGVSDSSGGFPIFMSVGTDARFGTNLPVSGSLSVRIGKACRPTLRGLNLHVSDRCCNMAVILKKRYLFCMILDVA